MEYINYTVNLEIVLFFFFIGCSLYVTLLLPQKLL